MSSLKDWLTVNWVQGNIPLRPDEATEDCDNIKARCGRAGSLAAHPGERLLELLRPAAGTPRRHSTAACPPPQPHHTLHSGFKYCPSDALPYCPPSGIALSVPRIIKPPVIIPPLQHQPPPIPQRTMPLNRKLPPPPIIIPVLSPTQTNINPLPPAPPARKISTQPLRKPPPTPPRPQQATDPNGNPPIRKTTPVSPQQRVDFNKNPQPKKPTPVKISPLPDNTTFTNGQSVKRSPSSGSNVSVRQDSNVSSDSFSQTSSPSYTTKTMEAPLLPHQHINKSINAKIAQSLLAKEAAEKDSNSTSITKSMSTPASLQTIVRFQNGSNMSLHHKMLRDMRDGGPASPHRFRLMQLVVNVIALAAIAGGLATYFRAYPIVQVQYVSQVVVNRTMPEVGTVVVVEPPGARNPAPGVCLPVIVNFCQAYKIPYNFTVFPNYVGHFGQREAQDDLEMYDSLVDVRCYELTALFLCTVFVPKCGPLGHMVRPCRSLCQETMRRCGFFLEVFGLAMPDYLQCKMFPESADTDVCIGNKEVKDVKFKDVKAACPLGFQCDGRRCIPQDWRCDGHVDCFDSSDELNCGACSRGHVHCGANHCIAQSHICNGVAECPWGQDERNCLRLSAENGDVGRGLLQLRANDQTWEPACLSHWDNTTASSLCALLGYTAASDSRLEGGVVGRTGSSGGTATSFTSFQRNIKGLMPELHLCSAHTSNVHLVCQSYECGKRRVKTKGSKRIVGGVEASPGDWPFLAAILGGPEEVFYCAGVLIADQWVLTASHCVGNHSDVSGWTIQLGITRRRSHAYYGQKVKVRRVVPHPLYNYGIAHDNDVALFQLAERVRYHEQLSPVCLPPPGRNLDPGTLCTVIGWGKRDDKDVSDYEPAINEVVVPVLDRDLCNQWLEHRDLNVTEGMVCAGYAEGGKDACQGDSGGPLLCKDPEDGSRWYVGGIVSWGVKCAHPRLPGVYAYVSRYVDWILKQIDTNNPISDNVSS